MIIMIKQFKANFQKLLLLTSCMLLITSPFVFLDMKYPHTFNSLNIIISQKTAIFTIMRFLVIGLTFLVWQSVIRFLAKQYNWDNFYTNYWIKKRFNIICWLLVFELLVCDNILLKIIKSL